jgi:hypothetical protein
MGNSAGYARMRASSLVLGGACCCCGEGLAVVCVGLGEVFVLTDDAEGLGFGKGS